MTDSLKELNLWTGFAPIDAEHEVQIGLMENLERVVREGRDPEAGLRAHETLTSYLDAHFLSEQLLMRRHAYPGYEPHVRDHDRAILLMDDLRARCLRGETTLTLESLATLRGWLFDHIKSRDTELAAFLKGRGVGSS